MLATIFRSCSHLTLRTVECEHADRRKPAGTRGSEKAGTRPPFIISVFSTEIFHRKSSSACTRLSKQPLLKPHSLQYKLHPSRLQRHHIPPLLFFAPLHPLPPQVHDPRHYPQLHLGRQVLQRHVPQSLARSPIQVLAHHIPPHRFKYLRLVQE